MARHRVNDNIAVWERSSSIGLRVSIHMATRVGMVEEEMTSSEARGLAKWILRNVPDEPERDREADMEALAKGVIHRLAYTTTKYGPLNIAIYSDQRGVCLDFVLLTIGMPFDVPGGFHGKHSDESYAYAQSLWDDLIPWMKKRYGGA